MCGRLALAVTREVLEEAFPDVQHADVLRGLDLPRYNVAPTETVPAVVAGADGPEWAALSWWLTPRWAKERTNKYATFNARAEDVAAKPAFRASYRDRRCLVVGTAFYEWQKLSAKEKRPYAVRIRDGSPLVLAGVWDRWVDRETGEIHDSCAVVTTTPNRLMEGIHDRMPVLVSPNERDVWLYGTAEEARHVMRPYDPDVMEAVAVSAYVSDARNEGPECARPIPRPSPTSSSTATR